MSQSNDGGKPNRARLWSLTTLIVAVAVLYGGVAWQLGALEPLITAWYRAEPRQPSVIFIVVDTLRADRVSKCGYDRPTTPNIDSLIDSADAWTCRAYAPGSWTLPSHASFFSGQTVLEHGAHFVTTGSDIRGMTIRPLPDDRDTLAEHYRERGFQTAGISANPVLVAGSGLAQGFDTWQVAPSFGPWYGEQLVDRVRDTVRTLEPSTPLFLFVNIADAHDPWLSTRDGPDWIGPSHKGLHYFASKEPREWEAYVTQSMSASEQVAFRKRIGDLYTYAVYRADRTLGRVLETLEQHGWLGADTRLVVTSDHGEFLGEHQLARHGRYLWEPNVRVPLIVRGFPGAAFPEPVSALVVHDLLKSGKLPEPMPPIIAAAFPDRFWFERSGGAVGGSTSVALWFSETKLLWQDGHAFRLSLEDDPEEMHPLPLAGEIFEKSGLAELASRAGRGAQAAQELDLEPDLERALRAGGYVE